MRTQLKNLNIGDTFQMYDTDACPLQRIISIRDVEMTNTSDVASIMMMLSGNVYTLERTDSPGQTFEITLDCLQDVYTPSLKALPPIDDDGRISQLLPLSLVALLATLIVLGVVLQ